jgi:hypothetical protein
MPQESLFERQGWLARLQVAMATVSLGVAFVLYAARYDIERYFDVYTRYSLLAAAFFALQGVAFALLLYLKGDIRIRAFDRILVNRSDRFDNESFGRDSRVSTDLDNVKQELAALQARLASLGDSTSQSTNVDYDRVVASLRAHVTERLAKELEERFIARAQMAAYVAEVRAIFSETSTRLRQEISLLSRRGNLNLVIGVLTTALAAVLLAYMVLGVTHALDSWPALLSYYVPRVTTAAFIEVFAFFFLRLYRNTLAEIKYYQNELTNLAVQRVAFEAAHGLDDQKSKSVVIEYLASSSRNRDMASPDKPSLTGRDLKEVGDLVERVTKLVAAMARIGKGE